MCSSAGESIGGWVLELGSTPKKKSIRSSFQKKTPGVAPDGTLSTGPPDKKMSLCLMLAQYALLW